MKVDELEYLKQLSRAKVALRRDLVALPYAEKIRRVVEMQKLLRSFSRDKSRQVFVWDME